MSSTSNISGNVVRVRPEDESREGQMVDDGLGPVNEDEDQSGVPAAKPQQGFADDFDIPGDQERALTPDEKLDEALEETFPSSDPIEPSRINRPNN